ncbi:hypothetical protein PLICRDRAFT_45054 [Plicaturopsis crispa FD-325 SS-3]|nr:hypothetical protein PLICRDRAFT_45054 [Plicaturopsis crispa FD-325 SS-3]
MGTRGYRSYRHKGRYFVSYNHCDSYPSGLGVQVLASIPKGNREVFNAWLERMRTQLDADYEELKGTDDVKYFVSDDQPVNDLFIEWIYEIDLDRLVFLVDTEPVFRLDHMPPEDVFLRCIGFDHYGHRAPVRTTPAKYRYDWTAPAPRVDDVALEAYVANKEKEVSAATLLEVADGALSDGEQLHVQLLEVLVGNVMTASTVGHSVRLLENVADRKDLTRNMRDIAGLLPCLAILPMIFPCPKFYRPKNLDAIWLRRDVVLRIATHLDDQRNMQAAVAALVSYVKSTDEGTDVVYGIVFSIFHCVLIRIDKRAGGSFDHTPVLQFLPSFYAESPSTPGITALARLGFQAHSDGVERASQWLREAEHFMDISISFVPRFKTLSSTDATALDRLPTEILEKIARKIIECADLLKFACVSDRCKLIAERLLRAPFIDDLQLTKAIPRDPVDDIAAGEEEDDDDDDDERDESRGHNNLTSHSFAAVSDRYGSVLVHLGEIRPKGEVLGSPDIELPNFARSKDLGLHKILVTIEQFPEPSVEGDM